MISIHFWSLRRLRAAQAIELPYTIPCRVVTAEEAAAEAAAAPDRWVEIHGFMEGWGWENQHRRQTLFQRDINWLERYLATEGLPGFGPIEHPLSDRRLNYLYSLYVEHRRNWAAKQPPRPAPSFTRFSMPRIANRPTLPNLREILAANPLRIEP